MPCGVFAGEPYLRRRQRRGQLRSDAYEGGTACALYTHNLAYSKEGCYDLGNSHTAGIAHTAPRPVDSLLEGRCEVVDDDEEDVGLRGLRGSRKRGRQRSGEDKREHGLYSVSKSYCAANLNNLRSVKLFSSDCEKPKFPHLNRVVDKRSRRVLDVGRKSALWNSQRIVQVVDG